MLTAESIAHGLQGKRSGSQYLARCPAHDDSNPSLSLRDLGGKVLVRCHAGCSQKSVLEALRRLGLWPEADGEDRNQRRIVTTYTYTDESAAPLYEIVRFEPKDFRPRYLDSRGVWVWKKHPRQVLYRLPELLNAPIIFVVEGEKDVEALRDYGFVATTNAGGAKAPWLPNFTDTLRGREVNIIPDRDQPGLIKATVVARALIGHAERIRILQLPEHIHDISDWFIDGHSECELIALLEGADVL